jgi:hypothetical protein
MQPALLLLLFAQPAWPAAEVTAEEVTPEVHSEWEPPLPNQDDDDWIQIETHEWLKGRLLLIQEDTVHFDSKNFDDLEFDWDDVIGFRSADAHTFRFTRHRIVTGTATMHGQKIRIRTVDGEVEFERSEFVGMIKGAGRELDYWSLKLSLGLSGQAGNTSQLLLNALIKIARETPLTRQRLDYTGNVATQDREISANTHRGTLGLDVFLTRRFFIVVPAVEAFQDEFQNIELRITPAVGLGYRILNEKKYEWQVGLATGYQGTKFYSVAEGDDFQNDWVVQLNTAFEIDIRKRFEWETSYQMQIVPTDTDKTSQNVSSTLSLDFLGPLNLDTTFQWSWVNQPTGDSQGNTPARSDFRISVGFGIDL